MFPAQVGKTEGSMNVLGYYMDYDPAPMLSVLEDEGKAEDWSKNRLNGLLTETPCLQGKVRGSRGKDAENTLTYKAFPGGYIAIAGAGSEAELTSRPIRVLILDELDKYKPLRAGDAESLAMNRQITFRHRAKTLRVSTPRDKGLSRIEAAYLRSDQRKYYVPCPHCGAMQVLKFPNLKWLKKEGPEIEIEAVWYECDLCHMSIEPQHKTAMVAAGKWIAERPFKGHAGFWMNVLYSPWVNWQDIAAKFLITKNIPELFKVFVNEWLAETWEDFRDKVDEQTLYGRREPYGPQVPFGAGILTVGSDVQENRIEASTWAWGMGEEAWLIDHSIFYGDPSNIFDDSWKQLDEYCKTTWHHENGKPMQITAAFVDAGYLQTVVCKFCAGKSGRRIFAMKGDEGRKKYITDRPRRKGKADLVIVAVDMIKEVMFRRLRMKQIEDTGAAQPGFLHFPISERIDLDYFEQLTNETPMPKTVKGRTVKVWTIPAGKRCEAWDCLIYAYAALEFLKIRKMADWVAKYQGPRVVLKVDTEISGGEPIVEATTEIEKTQSITRQRRIPWARRW